MHVNQVLHIISLSLISYLFSLSYFYTADLISLKGKLQDILKVMEQKEKDYFSNLKSLREQFSNKEDDYKAQIRSLKSSQQVELDQLHNLVRQLETKLFSGEQHWRETEDEYKKREPASHEFIQSLQKEIHEMQQVNFIYFFNFFNFLFFIFFIFLFFYIVGSSTKRSGMAVLGPKMP